MDFFSLEGVKVLTGYSVVLFFSATALIVLVRTAPKLGTMLLGPSGKDVSSTRVNSFMAIVTIFGAYLIITLANAQSGKAELVQLDLNTVLLLLVAMSPVLAEKALTVIGKNGGGGAGTVAPSPPATQSPPSAGSD